MKLWDQNDKLRKVVEYRLLVADSQSALAEYTIFLTKQGWKEYGGSKYTNDPTVPGKMIWLQPMVVYEGMEYNSLESWEHWMKEEIR